MNINIHNITGSVHFMWDLKQDSLDAMAAPLPDHPIDTSDYMGAVFFGKFKLEFILNDVAGTYSNLFELGAEDEPGHAYYYLEDGTPYEQRDSLNDEIRIHGTNNLEEFAEDIERQIIQLLEKHPDYITVAMQPTEPTRWYPCNHPYKVTITRVA